MRRTVQPADRQFLKRQKGVQAKIAALAFTLDKPLLSLLQCHISVFPRACCRVELWFFTLLHTGLFVLKLYGYTPLLASITNERAPVNEWAITLEVSIVSISTTFMALLLVFYNSQCYGRFMSFYHASCGMGGALQEIAEITSVTMAGSPAQRWDVCRYALASATTIYEKVLNLSRNKLAKLNDEAWERLMVSEEAWLGTAKEGVEPAMPALLDDKERFVLCSAECAGKEFQILQMWSLDAAYRVYAPNGGADGLMCHYGRLEDAVLRLRSHGAAITNLLEMPVPFPYYHILVVIMFVNFTLFSVAFLDLNSYATPVAMFLIVFIFSAMRELSSALANPLGTDEAASLVSAYVHKQRELVSFLACSERWQMHAYVWEADAGDDGQQLQQLPLPHLPPHPADLEAAYATAYAHQEHLLQQQQQLHQLEEQLEQQQQQQQYEPPYDEEPLRMEPLRMEQRFALEQLLAEQGAQIAALQANLQQVAAARSAPNGSAVSSAPRGSGAAPAAAAPTAAGAGAAPAPQRGTLRPAGHACMLPPVVGPRPARRGPLKLDELGGAPATAPCAAVAVPTVPPQRAPPPLPSSDEIARGSGALETAPPNVLHGNTTQQRASHSTAWARELPPDPVPQTLSSIKTTQPSAAPTVRAPLSPPPAAAAVQLPGYECVNVNGKVQWQPVRAGAHAEGENQIVYEKED